LPLCSISKQENNPTTIKDKAVKRPFLWRDIVHINLFMIARLFYETEGIHSMP